MEPIKIIIAIGVAALILFLLFVKNSRKNCRDETTQLTSRCKLSPELAGAGAEPVMAGCTPIPLGALLTSQLKDVIPELINKELAGTGPINYSTPVPDLKLTIGMTSTVPLQMEPLVFDPFNSNICGNTLTVVGRVILHTDGVKLKLFAEETVGVIILQADLTMKLTLMMLANGSALQVQSLSLSNLTVNAPSRLDISFIVAAAIPSLLEYINGVLLKLISSTVPLPPSLKASNNALTKVALLQGNLAPSVEAAIIDFLTRQMNAVIKSSLVSSTTFKACSECLPSTIDNIQLGKSVYTQDDGCAGVNMPFGIGCAGCSWGYRAGVNSIRGLGNMQIQKLELGQVNLMNLTTVRVYFSLLVTCSGVRIYVRSQVQPCTGGYIGFEDLGVPVPGTVMIQLIDAYVEGSYDAITKVSNFNSASIKIPTSNLSISIPTGWVKIDTGSSVVDGILSPIIRLISDPSTGLFQSALNSIIRSSLNGTIKGILQDVVGKIPTVTVPIPGLNPTLVVERRKDAGADCGWPDHPRGYYNATGRPSGEKLDYCRFVGNKPDIWFGCALAGTTDQYTDRSDPKTRWIFNEPHDAPIPGDSCYGR